MAYKAYVTPKYYLETYRGTSIPESELDLRLRDASRHIDSLTYSRIVGQGFSALTEFQQDVIREVVCRQADFEAENRETLDCALFSYSINGVSMTLAAGLNCVQYKNGARHTLADYADMAIRTACKRAKLQGEGQMRQEWGVSTVIMNKRGNPCPKCLPWVGNVLIDDVWSGGSRKDGPYPLMSTAIAAGLYHPRCKDGHTTYFEGISTPPDNQFTRKELKQIEKDNRKEAQKQYAERQREKFGRLADYSLDPENKERYAARKNAWEQEKAVEKRDHPAIMESDLGAFKEKLRKDANINREYYNCLKEKFSHGSDDAKRLFAKYASRETIADSYLEGTAHYESTVDKIFMHYGYDSHNPRGAGATWFHEHGHLIDHALGDISNKRDFLLDLQADVFSYQKKYEKIHGIETMDDVNKAISKELYDMRRHSAVSDMFEGITNGKIVGCACHGVGYWKKHPEYVTSEAFAHMYEAQFDSIRYGEMKKYFPGALKSFEKMMKEMAK